MNEKKRILIVDDDKTILKTTAAILRQQGYDVQTAETGRQAIEKSKAHMFNLALLDVKLPDMEGTELLTRMHHTTPGMMKVMVTGYPSLDSAVTAVNLGADAYLLKPVNPSDLLKTVEDKLTEQSKAEMLTEDKVAEWIQSRLEKARPTDQK